MRGTKVALALMLSLAVAVPSFGFAEGGAENVRAAPQSYAWTIAVYVSGDNTLSGNVGPDLEEIRVSNVSNDVKVIALVDESGDGDTRIVELANHTLKEMPTTTINPAWSNELDLGNPSVLRRFAEWARGAYPADRYGLDLWGHGTGWAGVCMDEGDWLTMPELSEALDGMNFAIISMAACQMGMAETAYELRDRAQYFVASEKDVPAEGWHYSSWLPRIGGGNTTFEVARSLATSYMSWARNYSAYSATISVVNLSKMDGLASALDSLASELWSSASLLSKNISKARGQTEEYDGDAEYDIVNFAGNLRELSGSARLGRLALSLERSTRDAVAYSDAWTNALDEPANHANGLSLWVSARGASNVYMQLKLSKDTRWDEFLNEYANAVLRAPVAVGISVGTSDADMDGLADTTTLETDHLPAQTVIFEVSNELHSYSAAEDVAAGTASATFHGIPGGLYAAAVYAYDASGRLLGFAEVQNSVIVQSWLYVNGTVHTRNGAPVEGANVEVSWGGENEANATTDEYGRFSLKIIYPASQSDGSITAETDGAEPLTILTSGGTEVQFALVKKGGGDMWMILLAFLLLDMAFILGINAFSKWRGGKAN